MNTIIVPSRSDIPIGRDNAIGRAELAQKWECSDRRARMHIAEFRAEIDNGEEEFAILSSSVAPAGYWRSNDPAELREYIRETENRAKMNFVALRGAKKLLRRIDAKGQVSMGDVMGA